MNIVALVRPSPGLEIVMATKLVNISEVILNGVVFDPKNSGALRAMDAQELVREIRCLFAMLDQREIDYLLVGGIAMLVYVDGRNTQGIDLIVDAESLDNLPEINIEDRNQDFARGHFGNLRVDLLFANNQLFAQVRRGYAAARRFVECDIPCATVEGLFLLKAFALPSLYRRAQFGRVETYERDLATLIRNHELDLSALLDVLSQYVAASDLREIREIVDEMEQRIARAPKRFKGDDAN